MISDQPAFSKRHCCFLYFAGHNSPPVIHEAPDIETSPPDRKCCFYGHARINGGSKGIWDVRVLLGLQLRLGVRVECEKVPSRITITPMPQNDFFFLALAALFASTRVASVILTKFPLCPGTDPLT